MRVERRVWPYQQLLGALRLLATISSGQRRSSSGALQGRVSLRNLLLNHIFAPAVLGLHELFVGFCGLLRTKLLFRCQNLPLRYGTARGPVVAFWTFDPILYSDLVGLDPTLQVSSNRGMPTQHVGIKVVIGVTGTIDAKLRLVAIPSGTWRLRIVSIFSHSDGLSADLC